MTFSHNYICNTLLNFAVNLNTVHYITQWIKLAKLCSTTIQL